MTEATCRFKVFVHAWKSSVDAFTRVVKTGPPG